VSPRDAWIRALLRLYPEGFRKAHGPELLELYGSLEIGLLGATWDLLQNAW